MFLARALAQEAHVLLLDEPFTGLDRTSKAALAATLRQLTGRRPAGDRLPSRHGHRARHLRRGAAAPPPAGRLRAGGGGFHRGRIWTQPSARRPRLERRSHDRLAAGTAPASVQPARDARRAVDRLHQRLCQRLRGAEEIRAQGRLAVARAAARHRGGHPGGRPARLERVSRQRCSRRC